MSAAKHTPGPWSIQTEDPEAWVAECYPFWIVAPKYYAATVGADARLIAAAPDMLAALEELLDAAERHIFAGECLHQRDAARAAIAKARGA